jgi:hypothetical protein
VKRKSLTLSRETLTELATADLAGVVGAADLTTLISKALGGCGTSVNPKCPGMA